MNNIALNLEICEHKSALDLFARKFTNDLEDANDLVQDTMIKAIRYSNLYKEGTNLKGWLYTIMRNTFINSYRKVTRKNSIMDTSEELSSAQLKNSASANLGENKFVMEDINKALSVLEPVYSVPFLRYFEGYKYHEIAEELDIPIGTVKTRIHMARQVLKNNLKMYAQQYKHSA
ncbi:RNA polymerase sigma factor (sigma-70 family) [Pedobacter sp. UYP24]